ncbi:hypothetical protein STIAU_6225 [Stigmatella aurantiaca DW4/3-1]|uniref:Uncharacterized protein n=1 Tax=Stigmatella aurantiaca (strain DW4/3-1) TaxID=378806 RepID=Q08ZA1_STIAD|nr:hypothetical protein STIAU_6225 [Stigmatella aurantiaca DW4/3-1]
MGETEGAAVRVAVLKEVPPRGACNELRSTVSCVHTELDLFHWNPK